MGLDVALWAHKLALHGVPWLLGTETLRIQTDFGGLWFRCCVPTASTKFLFSESSTCDREFVQIARKARDLSRLEPRICSRAGSGAMLSRDTDVDRAREHRPLSRGSRTAPSPTRVVLRSGPCRIMRHGPATFGWRASLELLGGVCARAHRGGLRATKLPRRHALCGHRRRRLHRLESRRRARGARRSRDRDRLAGRAASARTSMARSRAARRSR